MKRLGLALATVILAAAAAPAANGAVAWIKSPSKNIACQMSHRYAGQTSVTCQTYRTAKSVTLRANGTLRVCRGVSCIGDPPVDRTATLRYGVSKRVGPFRCSSIRAGMRCVVIATGRGFLISRDAVRPVRP